MLIGLAFSTGSRGTPQGYAVPPPRRTRRVRIQRVHGRSQLWAAAGERKRRRPDPRRGPHFPRPMPTIDQDDEGRDQRRQNDAIARTQQ